jgi:hypothetical protein
VGRNTYFTRLTFDLPQPTAFLCRVYPQGSWTSLGKLLGGQDVSLGGGPFDDQFVVKTNDEAQAREVLTSEVQESLLELKQWAQEHFGAPADWTLEGSVVLVRVGGRLTRVEDMMAFYEHGGQVFDAVREAL